MKLFFADTFYWIALINRRDADRAAVLRFSRSTAPKVIVTTDEVLTELLAFCASDSRLRAEAAAIVRDMLSDGDVRVTPQSRAGFFGGLALYEARPDKNYSLTDCISMQTMRIEGILDVLTNDHHFEQEGFHAIFRRA